MQGGPGLNKKLLKSVGRFSEWAKLGCCENKPRQKRSKLSLEKIKDFQFFEFEELGFEDPQTTPVYSALPVIQAHGVGGPGYGGEGNVFLSANNSRVETHKGTDITLNCRVARDSDYGTVSKTRKQLKGGDNFGAFFFFTLNGNTGPF